jgi:hypothetical protein
MEQMLFPFGEAGNFSAETSRARWQQVKHVQMGVKHKTVTVRLDCSRELKQDRKMCVKRNTEMRSFNHYGSRKSN